MLVLAFGLYPDEKRDAVLSHLLKMIEDNDGLHDTGFPSVPFLLDTLVESGASDVAYRMLFEDRCPSWPYEVKMGATTTWEAWQAMLPDGSPTNVSYNHYANGCVGDFIYRRIGGLTATAPGYRTFDVRPVYRCGLERASHGYDSVNGRIEVAWGRFGGQVELKVCVPQNTRARVSRGCGDRGPHRQRHPPQVLCRRGRGARSRRRHPRPRAAGRAITLSTSSRPHPVRRARLPPA